MVSTNTVLLDNPSLTARYWTGKTPIRVAIDRNGVIPENFNLKDQKVKTLIFTCKDGESKPNLEYVKMDNDRNNLPFILKKLYDQNIHSVLVEGGAMLLSGFIQTGLWDECNIEISPTEIGDGVRAPLLTNAAQESEIIIEKHHWKHFYRVSR